MSHSQHGVAVAAMPMSGEHMLKAFQAQAHIPSIHFLEVHEDDMQARQVGLWHNSKSCDVCIHVLQLKLWECGCQLMWWLAGMCST